ncbi:MAG: AAA family ATPase [Oscillospiraceae bacterium]|jgi:energy-coupling factor transporter ATP-binding protein EcfA2|nr:AAA family ATPase [Oscillospiraceae bacterium]
MEIGLGNEVFKVPGLNLAPRNFKFDDNLNIIVGKNGGGKTQLLKCLRNYYKASGDRRVVNLSYPQANYASEYMYTLKGDVPEIEKIIADRDFSAVDNFLDCVYNSHDNYLNKDYEGTRLNEIMDKLISRRFKYDRPSYGVKFTRDEKVENMSPGQRSLFYTSFLLYLLEEYTIADDSDDSKKLILLVDEPELHLHPGILIEFIKLLRDLPSVQTVWVATHAVTLLPSVEFDNITLIKDGELQERDSGLYRAAFNELLGDVEDGDGLERFRLFFANIDAWSYYDFISQCLTAKPETVPYALKDDAQVNQFVDFVNEKRDLFNGSRLPFTVLDFGGGDARLGKNIYEYHGKIYKDMLYKVYDPFHEIISNAWIAEYFNDFNVVKKSENEFGAYEVVVLMNTLHEIPVVGELDWLDTFRKIQSVIATKGYLMLVEVPALRKGEKPDTKHGYIVLEEQSVNALFDTDESNHIRSFAPDKSSNAFFIPATLLDNVTTETIKDALKVLKDVTHEKILQRENLKPRVYAFYTQQYFNIEAALALCEKRR